MQYIDNKNGLLDLVAQGAVALSPNNRLSNALLRDYFAYNKVKTLRKPACFPYGTAIIQAYQQFIYSQPNSAQPILLNTAQCQHLWRTIIKAESSITYSEGLLCSVMQAWEHCQQWQIDMRDPIFNYTPQTYKFQQWCLSFEQHLSSIHAIHEHQLISYLIEHDYPVFTHPVIWICFDDFYPQQQRLQAYLNDNNIAQYRYDLPPQNNHPQVLAAADNQEEYQQLLAWLHLRIAQNEQRIAVVIPNLEQKSVALQRKLREHFDASLFNISLGQSLSEFPLVAHALNWLNLGNESLNMHQAALLLQSPYIGAAQEEFIARSHCLQDSTLLQEPSFSLQSLLHDLQSAAPKLSELLGNLNTYPAAAAPGEWVRLFQERLNRIGFPGNYGLNSESYQCFHRLTTLLDEFRQLSLITPYLSLNDALAALARLAENTIFQAQKTNARIQISGLLEASGCEFDSLWVTGLTDQCLPQKTRLSAFIPPELQRSLNMPHSAPERELLFAKQTLERLQRGSQSTVFSFAHLQDDTPNLPCSLIIGFPQFTPLPVHINFVSTHSLITMTECYEIPLLAEEVIAGGTALLANQAKCPFKAFAEHRLKAQPNSPTAEGLDSKEKGQLIHKIMELFWGNLKSQQELCRLTTTELDNHIDNSIQQALNPLKEVHPDSFPLLIQEVEYIRLKRLITAQLEWEKQRPDFTVAALEQSYTIRLAGIDFKVRVDRLDQVGDKKWVIDYKSTLPLSKPWNEDRPKEPQLLLYALLDEHINALVLMQLKTGKVICSGFSEEKYSISGMSSLKKDETWALYRDNWQQQLTYLAEEFQQGHCPPLPQNKALCQQCDFQSLCRFQIN